MLVKFGFGIETLTTNITINTLGHLMRMLLSKMTVQLSQLAKCFITKIALELLCRSLLVELLMEVPLALTGERFQTHGARVKWQLLFSKNVHLKMEQQCYSAFIF